MLEGTDIGGAENFADLRMANLAVQRPRWTSPFSASGLRVGAGDNLFAVLEPSGRAWRLRG